MAAPKKPRCKECDVEVGFNFDHVGDCETSCSGTFEHPHGRCKARRAPMRS